MFSVGWNDIGGWRLWLRDRSGNEFYYAHLSAYSPLAVNGRQVKAGDVLGFMGKTGDAEFSPVHLHFEIHPVSLLARGYDGAVAPYPFLNAWRRAQDVSFDAGRAYLPLDGPGVGAERRRASGRRRPARGGRHLEHERARARRARVDPLRPGSEEPDRGSRPLDPGSSLRVSVLSVASTASATASALPFAAADEPFPDSSPGRSKPSSGWRSSSPATLSISQSRVCGPVHGL